jgi:small-conductance mechanosensitive channel
VAFLPRLGLALIIFVAFWIAAKIMHRVVSAALASLGADRAEIVKLLATAARATLLVFGAITALGTVGIDVTALVASLGLAGFGLAFALRDTISNVLAGMIVLMYRPFSVGDHVATAGFEGKVVTIDLRYTTIESDDDRHLIPNSTLLSRPVTVPRGNAATRHEPA